MTQDEIEDFQWTYAIGDARDPKCKPISTFMRLHDARAELERYKAEYPDLDLSIFVRGDTLWMGDPAIHEQTH